jgi:hypothetical protein
MMTFESYRVPKAIPQVKEKNKTDDGDGLAIVASPAQSSYIGLSALAATCKEFCFLSILRFQTSLLLLIIVRATLPLPFCAVTINAL